MKKTVYPEESQESNNESYFVKKVLREMNNLWDFLQKQLNYSQPHSSSNNHQQLDGVQFKYQQQTNDDQNKMLQVFTQVAHIGDTNIIMMTLRDMS